MQLRILNTLKICAIIRWKYRKLFSLFSESLKLGEKIITAKSVIWDESNAFSRFIIIVGAKNLHRMNSIEVLCKNGLAKDAVLLLRTMFEDLVDFQYIYEDKQKLQDYIDYDCLYRLRLGRILLNIKGDYVNKERVQEEYEKFKQKWESVKHRFMFTTRDGKKRICSRWSCKNLREMSQKVDLEGAYNFLFGYLSHFVHSTSLIANEYIFGLDESGKNVVVGVGPNEKLIPEVLATASINFLGIVGNINDEYKTGFDTKIKQLAETIKNQK